MLMHACHRQAPAARSGNGRTGRSLIARLQKFARGAREAAQLSWRWRTRRPRPRGITVFVTGRCDLQCRHCEKGAPHRGAAELPLGEVLRLIDLAHRLRVGLLLTGGEPCLHTGFREILEHACRNGVPLELNTNGYALADADASLIGLLNASVELLRVSLDSADAAEHDAARGVTGSHARALRTLRDPRLECRREISAVLALDLHNAGPLLAVARQVRCSIAFQPLIFGSNYPDLPRQTWKAAQQRDMPSLAADIPAILDGLRREAARLGVRTNLATLRTFLGDYYRQACGPGCFGDSVLPKFRCVIPYQRLTVDERGRPAPCAFMQGTAPLGEGDILRQWRDVALACRADGSEYGHHANCRSCGCYFAENHRASVVLDPVANRRGLAALLRG